MQLRISILYKISFLLALFWDVFYLQGFGRILDIFSFILIILASFTKENFYKLKFNYFLLFNIFLLIILSTQNIFTNDSQAILTNMAILIGLISFMVFHYNSNNFKLLLR